MDNIHFLSIISAIASGATIFPVIFELFRSLINVKKDKRKITITFKTGEKFEFNPNSNDGNEFKSINMALDALTAKTEVNDGK